jgi:hypothetical protein
VVAERRVELHARIEQRLVGRFELLAEVLRPFGAIQVVAGEHDGVVLEPRVDVHHLLREFVLLVAPCPEITEDAELEGSLFVGQLHRSRLRGLSGRAFGTPLTGANDRQ